MVNWHIRGLLLTAGGWTFDLGLSLTVVKGIVPTEMIFNWESLKNLWCILLHLFYIHCKEV